MTDARLGKFGDFGDRAWLNTAHQGALPLAAAAEAQEAVAWKMTPWALTQARFDRVPARLRAALGQLVGVPSEEIVLANSASYGLHLIANSYPWREGDEVLVMAGDFPTGKWGYIDTRGQLIVNPQFDDARPFSEGMAAVLIRNHQADRWGYISR